MLASLSIRNILLIEALDLDFTSGLNVLTGETGAGKSILLDSLGFVLGWRGRADLVRQGAEQGEVSACFEMNAGHSVFARLDEMELPYEDGQIIMRRVVSADGRKRGFVNDRSVSADVMRQIGDYLVEAHGQHDDKGLLDEKTHLDLLDQFGGYDLTPMRQAYKRWQAAQKAYAQFQEDAENAARDADFIRHSADELGKLDVQIGEAVALDESRRLMQKGEKLAGEISALHQLLSHEGLGQSMSDALRRAEALSSKLEGEMDEALNAIITAYDRLGEAESAVVALGEAMDYDPIKLEETEERLFAIRAAERKYQRDADELPALLAHYQQKMMSLDDQEGAGAALEEEQEAARLAAIEEAGRLHEYRVQNAKKLDALVMNELPPLKMENAVFQTEIEVREISADGYDHVRFVVRTNPGAPAGSLSKIASGGELSRFLLAIKVALQDDEDKTLLFDEIDRGVGGQTADAVGRRLRRLADEEQLIIVTHSPQVAAFGQRHFLVEKSQDSASTQTDVKPLSADARVEEIARMISGDQVSDEAMAAARKLIDAGSV